MFCYTAAKCGVRTAAKKTGSCISCQMPLVSHVPNSTILHLIGSYDLTTIMMQQRLRWLGHVQLMEDGRLPNDILYGEFYNAPRRTGWPKLRHKDVLKRDMAGFHISPQSWEGWKGRHFCVRPRVELSLAAPLPLQIVLFHSTWDHSNVSGFRSVKPPTWTTAKHFDLRFIRRAFIFAISSILKQIC